MRSASLLQLKTTQRRRSADNRSWRTQSPIDTLHAKFREVTGKLRRTVTDIHAILLVGPSGVIDYVVDDPKINVETIAEEYATLLRIARSASEDSGAGNVVENILVSEKTIMISRAIPPDQYLILVSGAHHQVGRARYELKQAAWDIQGPKHSR